MLLDVMCFTYSILIHYDLVAKTRIKLYVIIFVLSQIFINLLPVFGFINYVLILLIFILVIHYKGIELFNNCYLFMINICIMFILDLVGFVFLSDFNFCIYSLVYKIIYLSLFRFTKLPDQLDKLKSNILMNVSVSILILFSLIVKVIGRG